MKRKVNQVGTGTLTVSLPNKWVDKHGIKKGDEIEVDEEQENLIISTKGKKSKIKEIEIVLTSEEKWNIRSILGGIYRKGFDIVRIKYSTENAFSYIEDSINNLIGYEIFEKGKGYCIIKSMIMDNEDELKNITNRFIHSIKTIRSIVRADYESSKYNNYDEILAYRSTGWKFRDYSMRLAFNKLDDTPLKYGFISLIWILEKINRSYLKIYESMQKNKSKPNTNILQYYDEVSDLFDHFAKIQHTSNLKDIELLKDKYRIIHDKGINLVDKVKKDASILVYLIEDVRKISDLASQLVMIHF